MVALASKSYNFVNYNDGESKRGTKGIPSNIEIEMQVFKDVLFNEGVHSFEMESLRPNRSKVMTRQTCQKSGLTDLYIKFEVESDKITCTPLKRDGIFLYYSRPF